MKKKICMLAVFALPLTVGAQSIQYPVTEKGTTVDTYFGTEVKDPYRWLEDDRSAKTAAWVEAENAVTDSYIRKIPFRSKLLKRLKEVSNYEKVGTPFKRHGKWYFYKNDGLQNQSVLYVMDELGGTPRVFLDPNKLSDDGTVALKGIYFSHNGKYMAYSVSRSGSDWTEFYVMDVATGQLLDDHVEWTKFSGAAWYKDGFYYSTYDRPTAGKEYSHINEGHKIYYHKIGTPQSEDELFYQNPAHPKRFYSVSVNEEETMMFLYESGEGNGNGLYVRDLRKPNSQLIQMTSNMDFDNSVVEIVGDKIYLFTNDGAPKNRIMVTDIAHPGRKDWKEFIPEGENVLQSAGLYDWKWILKYSQDASTHIYLYGDNGQRIREIKLPGVGSASFSGDKDQKEMFYTFSTFTVPGTIYRYDVAQDKSTLYAAPKVNFNLNGFESKQVFFTSKDGTRVPMFLTYKKGMKLNGNNPVYLYGYGGFNLGMYPGFSATRIPFIENGGIYVLVNLRGGNEYGEEWHLAGTKMRKQNVFDDFISAAEYLIANKYTNKNKIAIIGGSNGGLLVGACMTQRPDLFRVAIPQVGVMDMLRYHKFTIGWNWAPDYGTSEDSKEMFEYLKGYSPLHNLKKGVEYPATLVTTADHDDRVVPAHSFKFAATLQECHKGDRPVLIRIDSKAGHGSGKPMSKVLEEQADIYGFIMYNLGMKVK
ncbi:MAG: S9 family peptidase [Prevotella sp.]|nr:S9 family peptidase [Prevotella sp.]